jgi:thioredoxin reductase
VAIVGAGYTGLTAAMLGKLEGRSAFSDIAFPSHSLHMLAKSAGPIFEAWYRLRDTGGF